MAVIKVSNLCKNYGPIQAIKNVSFEVRDGEILGFLGPNGAGKSTTMRILTGFFPPTSGTVEIAGLSIDKNLIDIKKKIGYLPENVPLYMDQTVQDFLKFVATIKKVSRRDRKKHIASVLEECSLTSVAHRLIGKLSKGYKQRVGLAQALIGNPDILILDEPTIGLDPKQIIEIRQLIKKMAGQKTVILSTHILPEVSMITDRVIIINEGEIIASDSPSNLNNTLTRTQELLLVASGDEAAVLAVLEALPNVLTVKTKQKMADAIEYSITCEKTADVRGAVASAIIQHNFKLLELKSLSMSLEDIFLKLVTKEEDLTHA